MITFNFDIKRFKNISMIVAHLFMNKLSHAVNKAIFSFPIIKNLLVQSF